MKVSVIGAGAIGGWLTAGFVRGGARATVLARGASLEALQRRGLILETADGGPGVLPVTATDDPGALRGADLLLLGVKAHDLPALVPVIAEAMTPGTLVMPAVNGLPFWYFEAFGGPARGMTLEAVDPGGQLARLMPSDRVLGNVVHAASHMVAPGHVHLDVAHRLLLGQGAEAEDIAALLCRGGLPASVTPEIHREIWVKLWGNANMNPLTALARADAAQLLDDPGACGLVEAMMREMAALGHRIGHAGFEDIAGRIATTRTLGPIRTSMLQDVEAGRPVELGPILGALVELAARLEQPMPVSAGVHGLMRLLDRNLRG
ncbi:2-dehydropantoate 2-reductase [Pseudooceanicola sp. CBS1P-1]|uniref:2-dehydropantoate 2-reductase n=1 Tax=Pseudooceanicola albus TaxID=2692189 RepID=A0A6L7GD14_9RHOB|nr:MULTISPECIES: 2-dehydropantoate 2-reductase [Pseudooceanicola]MBT9387003.1 2-dehydropantoate 2-reductase [Pseudooceanicola endophyticus]MXN21130.1 2-dehydropantoate 2-reductase [Pseudooceanicola albus]